jgi:hypothetical protein
LVNRGYCGELNIPVKPRFISAVFDIYCSWQDTPPSYRVFVNDELFSERTYIWTNEYLSEILQILAMPGQYTVRFEPVQPCSATFKTQYHRVEHGPGRWIDRKTLEIVDDHEST